MKDRDLAEHPRRHEVEVGEATLSVLRSGEGNPVVLIHGIPTGAELWRGLMGRLATAGLRALAPDLPGYGSTRLPEDGDHSLAGGAALVARWLGDSEPQGVWVVGHDAGGAVAQLLAVRHPDLVTRLTLVNSIAHGSWPAPRARFARLAARIGLVRMASAMGVVPNAYLRRRIRDGFAHPSVVSDEDLDRVVFDGKFSAPEGRAGFERHLRALDPADTAAVASALGSLPMPCQLIWGMADVFQPWTGPGQQLQQLLPEPSMTLLDDCGHLSPLECPQSLVDAMLAWHRPS